MCKALVSAIIPTYNRANFIARAVQSAQQQTYRNLEIIVVDDGSTDNTDEILQTFGQEIYVVRQANRGPSAARNVGLAHARGSLVAFLDSDDVWLPEKIELQVDQLSKAGSAAPCGVCNALLTNARFGCDTSFDIALLQGNVRAGLWRNPTAVLAARFVLFNQVAIMRREALETTGGFREDLWLLEDYDLAIRLSLLGPWGIIREPLVIKHDETAGSLAAAAESQPLRVLRAKESVLTAVMWHASTDPRLRRAFRFALFNIKLDMYAHALASRTQKLTSGLGRLLLTAFHFRDAAWRRSPWWPEADVVPIVGAAAHA
jgi:glycosyltransferase involved in cell wall biosynthesis